jgi:hypothetical protein
MNNSCEVAQPPLRTELSVSIVSRMAAAITCLSRSKGAAKGNGERIFLLFSCVIGPGSLMFRTSRFWKQS